MDLSLNDLVTGIVAGAFALVAVFTAISRILRARGERHSLAHRVVCRLCLHAFEDPGHGRIVDCPACHAATPRGGARPLG